MTEVFAGFKKFKFLDFVTAWFWKGANYIQNTQAKLALVATNSIAQGEQVAMLFPSIFALGIHIEFAYQSFPWKNNAKHNAAVHVVIIGLSATPSKQKTIHKLVNDVWHSQTVANISPYLVAGSDLAVKSRSKPINKTSNKMVYGNKPVDGGHLLLSSAEKDALLAHEPQAEPWIKKLLGANEFLNGLERWCLWLPDITEDELADMPMVSERIEQVRQTRLASRDKGANKLAERSHEFRDTNNPESFILIPRVSSDRRQYVPMGFFDSEIISTDANQMIPNGTLYEFGILTSLMHNDWMRLVAGRLGVGYRYSGTIVYNTFPFPTATTEQMQHIEELATEVLLCRAEHVGKTLAELYNPETMPDNLKAAHATLDEAVDKLYRPQGFANTEERLAHLLARYESLTKGK